jgi:hypothetical protein
MAAAAIIAGVGTAVSVYGMIAQSQKQSEAQSAAADLKNKQASELDQRQAINESIMRQKSLEAQSRISALGGETGVEGGNLGSVIRMQRDLAQQIAVSRREEQFKANMLRLGGEVDQRLSSDIASAGWISGTGTLLTGAAKTYDYANSAKPSTTSESLPGVK